MAGGVSTGNPDWVTIHGLLSLAVYGGRIDNTQDERLLGAYLQQYFSSAMLSPNARSTMRLAPGVTLPTSSRHAEYTQIIGSLPAQDPHVVVVGCVGGKCSCVAGRAVVAVTTHPLDRPPRRTRRPSSAYRRMPTAQYRSLTHTSYREDRAHAHMTSPRDRRICHPMNSRPINKRVRDHAVQMRAVATVQQTLRDLGAGSGAAAGFDRDTWAAQLSPLLSLWQVRSSKSACK